MSVYRHERAGDTAALVDLATGSSSDAVRARAVEALGGLDEVADGTDDADAVETLVAAATEDEAVAVRAAAIDALDRIGPEALERTIARLEGIETGDRAGWAAAAAYVDALDAERPSVRMAAATVLGRIGDAEAVGPLVERLEGDEPRPRVRARTARALGRIGDPRAAGALTGALDDGATAVRREAAVALGAVGAVDLDGLVAATDDPDEGVRRAAVDALGASGDPAALSALVDALDDRSGAVRRAAVVATVELLSEAPPERSHELRESVVSELRAAADGAVVEPLADLLAEGRQPRARRNATWLLGRVAGEDGTAAAALVDALDDDDATVARFAATGLAELGGDDVEGRLLALLDGDATADARAMAAFALGRVGGDRARERLERLVDEAEAEAVRRRALGALSKLGRRAP
jgi:HEAT repeat protein